MKKMILFLLFLSRLTIATDDKPNFELQNPTGKTYYFALSNDSINGLNTMARNLEPIGPHQTIEKQVKNDGSIHMIISETLSPSKKQILHLYTISTKGSPLKNAYLTIESTKNDLNVKPQSEDPMKKEFTVSGFSLKNNIDKDNIMHSETSLYGTQDPNFEFWNKSKNPVYIYLANHQPIKVENLQIVEPQKRYFTHMKNNNDYYIAFSKDPTEIQRIYLLERKPDQPVFVRLGNDGTTFGVQKGKKNGLSSTSQSGFSLKKNIKDKNIKPILIRKGE
ncbi:MAG: hypothetical protein WD055_00230 [Candidatus Dependentiae bacterium]